MRSVSALTRFPAVQAGVDDGAVVVVEAVRQDELAWRAMLDDLTRRGLKKPLVSLWSDLPIQRCAVRKLRSLVAHAPPKLAEETTVDYTDMI